MSYLRSGCLFQCLFRGSWKYNDLFRDGLTAYEVNICAFLGNVVYSIHLRVYGEV